MPKSMRAKPLGRLEKARAALLIATISSVVAWLAGSLPPLRQSAQKINTALYDSFYKHRVPQSLRDGPIVIISVDQSSIDRMAAEENHYRWPWPREYWGAVLEYLQKAGAKVVAFDLLFEEPSGYNRESDDDPNFAKALDQLTIPVIHAELASAATTRPRFGPPVTRAPLFGAVNVIDDTVVRNYAPIVHDRPSLAIQTARAAKAELSDEPWSSQKFLLHFYGPSRNRDGLDTFHYVPAYDVTVAARSPTGRTDQISPETFRGKIVLIGATAAAAFDLKSAPVATIYPSVEAQATAIQNLLSNQHVIVVKIWMQILVIWLGALIAAFGAVGPRRVRLKLPLSLAGVLFVYIVGILLFLPSSRIHWLPLSEPLCAAILATVVGLCWTYFIEDRQRRVLLQFLSQYVSPQVAAELSRHGQISLGGQRREMTVMFTDIADFTKLADRMDVEQLEEFMNFYLSEMSAILFEQNATLDKYIGDAIMSFWNAPLGQDQHAELACRAALRLRKREQEIREQFSRFGIANLRTRIGLNTGLMVVGNVGSEQKVNYTVLGDAVNLANRLEGANKIYGSTILVAESTMAKTKPEQFLFRRLDRLRVRGRSEFVEVFELLDEAPGTQQQRHLTAQYEAALAAYRQNDWDVAERILIDLVAEFPDDGPAAVLLKRVRVFRTSPPPSDWNGVHDAGGG